MAAGELERLGPQLAGQPGACQVRQRVFIGQVTQPDQPQYVAPARIGTPARRRQLAAGDHDQNARTQPGQEFLAQPVIKRDQQLVAVQNQQAWPAR